MLDFLNILGQPKGKAPAKPAARMKPKHRRNLPKEISDYSLDSPITAIKGVSSSLAARFGKLGVKTVRDLLYFFPHRHLDYSRRRLISQLSPGAEETIIANVWQAREIRLGGRPSTEAIVGDESGNVRVVWFNNPYLARKLTANMELIISGRVNLFKGRPVFGSPQWEPYEDKEFIHTGRLVPVYPLTAGLHPRQVRRLMKEVLERWADKLKDFLPETLKERLGLSGLPEAIHQAHFPDDEATKEHAGRRLAFDELFFLQLGLINRKRSFQEKKLAEPFVAKSRVLKGFIESLPFSLTHAQEKVLSEIVVDLSKPQLMSRLLQGEVGSGKTVVATAALLMAVANDYQGALMAPTEILAEQHFKTVSQLLSRLGEGNLEAGGYIYHYRHILNRPIAVGLLLGDTAAPRKRQIQKAILDGEIDIVIGTHALIQKSVTFHHLGLAVIDEQHRFGVLQRSSLRQKGYSPHMLVMTATPIPRTLALTLYGELDISIIDELPPDRRQVKTKWLKPLQRDSAYAFLRREVAGGHQAFIICPLVEESEVIQARAATAEYEHLSREVFPDLRLGLLHGRMSASEKDTVMRRFYDGQLDILVSTPVVEVGIDVPNATVMLVESAGRFGLSQLHQFRGRVGRGKAQSYCMLLSENLSEIGRERLDIIEKTGDGFALAEEDLKLRGPGEFFGTRQSGLPDLRMARLSDVALLELARHEANRLLEEDPRLEKPENKLLAEELARIWPEASE